MGCGASCSSMNSRRAFRTIRKNGTSQKKAGSMALLKALFKQMDPTSSQTRAYGDSCGQIQLAVRYLDDKEVLLVKLMEGRGLPAKDVRNNTSDAYVRLAVLPSPGGNNEQQSRTVTKSLHPSYNEIFTFTVRRSSLPESRLHCSVWDYDVVSADDFIGEVYVDLCDIDWTDTQPQWYDLTDKAICPLSGTMDVTVQFHLPQSLCVSIHNVRDLHYTEMMAHSTLKPYVICSVTGLEETYKSPVFEVCDGNNIDLSCEFNIPQEELSHRAVVVNVVDSSSPSNNRSEGQSVIELSSLLPDRPLSASCQLKTPDSDVDARLTVAQQSALVNEFQQALVAHAAFRQPSWLFAKKSQVGDKNDRLLIVSNRQGGQMASLRLHNGKPMIT